LAPRSLGGDVIPARQATLQTIKTNTGSRAVTYSTQTVDLFDDGVHGDGAMESDGIFGNVFTCDVAAVTDDLHADLYEIFIRVVIGEHMKLKTNRVGGEPTARQPCPFDRALEGINPRIP
jgi:hypothetical protein